MAFGSCAGGSKLMCATLNCYYFAPVTCTRMMSSALKSFISTNFSPGTRDRCLTRPGQCLAENLGKPHNFDPKF
eukprot:1161228-Pelagomonas_calceolata.AAC.3